MNELEVVGERAIQYRDGEDSRTAFVVRIYKPIRLDDGYYRCYFDWGDQIQGWDRKYSEGLDSIDALFACLTLVGMYVSHLNETSYDSQLEWMGGKGGTLGFPPSRST